MDYHCRNGLTRKITCPSVATRRSIDRRQWACQRVRLTLTLTQPRARGAALEPHRLDYMTPGIRMRLVSRLSELSIPGQGFVPYPDMGVVESTVRKYI